MGTLLTLEFKPAPSKAKPKKEVAPMSISFSGLPSFSRNDADAEV